MTVYVEWDSAGRITAIGGGPDGLPAPDDVAPETHFVAAGVVIARPVFAVPDAIDIKADGEPHRVLSGLPDGTSVTVGDEPLAVENGAVTIATTRWGTLRARLSRWPYRDMDVEITVERLVEAIVQYDETGAIDHIVTSFQDGLFEAMRDAAADGKSVALVPVQDGVRLDAAAHYMADGALCDRPVMDVPAAVAIVADGVDAVTLSVPKPCTAIIDGGPTIAISDGELTLTADQPENYRLTLVAWPWRPARLEVTAS